MSSRRNFFKMFSIGAAASATAMTMPHTGPETVSVRAPKEVAIFIHGDTVIDGGLVINDGSGGQVKVVATEGFWGDIALTAVKVKP